MILSEGAANFMKAHSVYRWGMAIVLTATFTASGAAISKFQVLSAAGPNSDVAIVFFTADVTPSTLYLVESSPDLQHWGPTSSAAVSSGARTLTWNHWECAARQARFYRLVEHHGSFSTVQPQGRLTQTNAGGAFYLTTSGGWSIQISKTSMKMTDPNKVDHAELWNSGAENFKGKHIKNVLSDRRTYILTDDTIITVAIDPTLSRPPENPMGQVQYISIYDGGQSHRINMQTLAIDRSSLIPKYGEFDEFDGETSRFVRFAENQVTGLRWENIYYQGDPCVDGTGVKHYNTVRLSQSNDANPNQVNDYYDDPRLGHT